MNQAAALAGKLARSLTEEQVVYVVEQLGLENYVDASNGKFELHDLTDLQFVAMAAALHAYNEANKQ